MKTLSLDAMRRFWCTIPALAFLVAIALLFSAQDMHTPAPDHGPDSHEHVEMMSSAHDPGAHQGTNDAEDCSVASCSLCLAVIPDDRPLRAAAPMSHRGVVRHIVAAGRAERPYRPPILSA